MRPILVTRLKRLATELGLLPSIEIIRIVGTVHRHFDEDLLFFETVRKTVVDVHRCSIGELQRTFHVRMFIELLHRTLKSQLRDPMGPTTVGIELEMPSETTGGMEFLSTEINHFPISFDFPLNVRIGMKTRRPTDASRRIFIRDRIVFQGELAAFTITRRDRITESRSDFLLRKKTARSEKRKTKKTNWRFDFTSR